MKSNPEKIYPGINSTKINDENFPKLLREIQNPPEKIYILGDLPNEKYPKIAVVGTRKATSSGLAIAKEISKELSKLGFVIVSGLAMGIDTAAHNGAISVKGRTIAVLANGLDSIYPRQNENLAKIILEQGGAIISEYDPGTPALEYRFLERNRIVSGLSIATIVIEAPERSGSLVTARLAAEQGREIFILPGPINHPNYKGSHKLIRDGARLITSIEDILEDLNIEINELDEANKKALDIKDENQKIIFEIISNAGEPLSVDRIIKIATIEPQAVNQALAILIINEIIRETEKGYTI